MSDPSFDLVTALLPFDGADSTTTITDESDDASTDWGFVNGGGISTTQSKFGGSSARIGSGEYIGYSTIGGTSHLFDVTDEFTIQLWVRPDAVSSAQTIIESGGLYFGINSSGELEFDGKDSGGTSLVSGSSTGTLSANTWHYVEISRDSSDDWRIFLDGTLEDTQAESAGAVDKQEAVQLGRKQGFSDLRPYAGYFDDLRITAGAVRSTATYTAPTSAHPTFSGGANAYISVPSPLTAPSVVVLQGVDISAIITVPSPLTAPSIVVTRAEAFAAIVSVPSPLAAPRAVILNDFSALVTDPSIRYIVRITGSPAIDVPISSWQATLQTGAQQYLQCVIPAATPYLTDFSARRGSSYIVVYRLSFAGETQVESEMARAPLSQININSGPFRETATISGYAPAYTDTPPPGTKILTGIRSTSQTLGGSLRVRADIDWFLRPGQSVTANDLTFTANYINYFVPAQGDAYMDVGSRG